MQGSAFLASVIFSIDWHLCQVHRRALSHWTFDRSLAGCRGGSTRSPCKGINDGTTLQIFHPLKQQCLVPFGFREKSRQSRRRETSALFVALPQICAVLP